MNIFVLDENVKKCAEYHCDKHVVKMITEHNQILGSISYLRRGISKKSEITDEFIQQHFQNFPRKKLAIDMDSLPIADHSPLIKKLWNFVKPTELSWPYGIGYKNHPCTQWANASKENYDWLCSLNLELCKEYTKRYNRRHAGEDITQWYIENAPYLPNSGMTPFVLAMPDDCKSDDPVESYRNYYIYHKYKFAKWKTKVPNWYINVIKHQEI